MNISDGAIEAAAKAMAALANYPLHLMEDHDAEEWRKESRAALQAAAPLIVAEEMAGIRREFAREQEHDHCMSQPTYGDDESDCDFYRGRSDAWLCADEIIDERLAELRGETE